MPWRTAGHFRLVNDADAVEIIAAGDIMRAMGLVPALKESSNRKIPCHSTNIVV
jgi:hypothetical protein